MKKIPKINVYWYFQISNMKEVPLIISNYKTRSKYIHMALKLKYLFKIRFQLLKLAHFSYIKW
ncbi:hypothetical protein C7972_10586 [Arenibacter sp. ARW7G5Y1]|nr:hypothetical protein C7972_10586 [Arenibacter sp. ARW7G5Y1]